MTGTRPTTIGELRRSEYRVLPIKEEMRKNLLAKMRRGDALFPGIIGYDDTVIPQIENAILSGQDIVLWGGGDQANARLARLLINLLDDEVPAIAGCEINDDPYQPICAACRAKVAEHGDDVEITWLRREDRYGEKLATPDITIADLIGEIDPVKVAEGRYLADEQTIAYGLIPRTNRGIFCINELPDLAERIQVGLLNIMEERDVQTRGYKARLPLDIYVVASANPEDYTNRGRIITPLKDRYGAQIRTHYPTTIEQEIDIVEQESSVFDSNGYRVVVPRFMKEIVAEITHLARKSSEVSQRSGVSVRMSIANYESLTANALKRAIRLNERDAAPRISDLPALISSTTGKIELESVGESREDKVVAKLIQHAVSNVFGRYFSVNEFEDVIRSFEGGKKMEASELMPSMDYIHQASQSKSMKKALTELGAQGSPAVVASGVEFILEGLHLNRKLNKDRTAGRTAYRR